MAKQRYINTKIWEDSWFSSLDQIEQLVFIYFLTNPTTNIVGAYELSKNTISRHTGLEALTLNEILSRFERSEKVFYVDGWIIISNFIKHQNYKSPKIIKGIKLSIEEMPEKIKSLVKMPEFVKKKIGYRYGIEGLSHSNSNLNSNSNINTNINILGSETPNRSEVTFKKDDYNNVLEAYQGFRGISLQGKEFDPVMQEIKTMFISKRTPEEINFFMEWLAEKTQSDDKKWVWVKNWTIKTVKLKIPEFLAGNFNE